MEDNLRVVLLGKTGTGKSSLANTIFEEEIFKTNDSPNSETERCQSHTKTVSGRSLCLIDTPGLFDTDPESSELSPELLKCISECAPGPHMFLLVLKVEKFTKQEQAVVDIILKYFTDDALKYTTVVFTHGDNLREGMKIEEWVSQNKILRNLVQKCGGRCHVIDNKYWNNSRDKPHPYRNNQYQVDQLIETINNHEGYYTNEMLQNVDQMKQEMVRLLSSGNKSEQEIRENAKLNTCQQLFTTLAGVSTGVLLGAFLGGGCMLLVVCCNFPNLPIKATAALVGVGAVGGAVLGGCKGYKAAKKAETPSEAAQAAYKEVKMFISKIKDMYVSNKITQ